MALKRILAIILTVSICMSGIVLNSFASNNVILGTSKSGIGVSNYMNNKIYQIITWTEKTNLGLQDPSIGNLDEWDFHSTLTVSSLNDIQTPEFFELYHIDQQQDITNIYFKRLIYTMRFDLNPPKGYTANMNFNGAEYTEFSDKYFFEAKVNDDISNKWPIRAAIATNGDNILYLSSWQNGNNAANSTMRYEFVPAFITGNKSSDPETIIMKANWSSKNSEIKLNYMVEVLESEKDHPDAVTLLSGRTYLRSDKYSHTINGSGAAVIPKTIDGLVGIHKIATYRQGEKFYLCSSNKLYNEQYIFYDRKSYNIYFDTGDNSVAVMYGEPIKRYLPTPSKIDYEFSGWSQNINTMPSRDILLTAQWTPTRVISIIGAQNTVRYNGKLQEVSGYEIAPEFSHIDVQNIQSVASGVYPGIYEASFLNKDKVLLLDNGIDVTNNYIINFINGSLTIENPLLYLEILDISKTVGMNDPLFQYSLLGETIDSIPVSLHLTREPGQDIGSYEITLASYNIDKYTVITTRTGNLKIEKSTESNLKLPETSDLPEKPIDPIVPNPTNPKPNPPIINPPSITDTIESTFRIYSNTGGGTDKADSDLRYDKLSIEIEDQNTPLAPFKEIDETVIPLGKLPLTGKSTGAN